MNIRYRIKNESEPRTEHTSCIGAFLMWVNVKNVATLNGGPIVEWAFLEFPETGYCSAFSYKSEQFKFTDDTGKEWVYNILLRSDAEREGS